MSKLGKLRKNAQNFNLQEIYNNMTPEDYRNGIRIAVDNATKRLYIEYQDNLKKLKNEYTENLKYSIMSTVDIMSIELLYELANQMGCFEKEPEYLEDKIYRVQEIYENTMNAIYKYTEYKTDKQAQKEFNKKRKKVEKMFNIKF